MNWIRPLTLSFTAQRNAAVSCDRVIDIKYSKSDKYNQQTTSHHNMFCDTM